MEDLSKEPQVERELMLIKLSADPSTRQEVMLLCVLTGLPEIIMNFQSLTWIA